MIEWDRNSLRFIYKKVSDYSGRKRINITNKDGLIKDDAVIIMKQSDFNELINDYERLLKQEQEQTNSKVTADAIADKYIKPIHESYDKQLKQYEETIKNKDLEIGMLRKTFHDYDKQVYNLGLLDILKHENKKISDNLNSNVWISQPDKVITDAEVKKLTGDNNGGQEE